MARHVLSTSLSLALVVFSTVVRAQQRPSENAARVHIDLRTGFSWTKIVDSRTYTNSALGTTHTFTYVTEKSGYHPPALRVMFDLGLFRAGMGFDHPFVYKNRVRRALTLQADVPIISHNRFCAGLNVHGGALVNSNETPGYLVGGSGWLSYSTGQLTQFTLTTSYDRGQQEPTFDKSEQVTIDAGMRFWLRTAAAQVAVWEERADRAARQHERRLRLVSTWRWVDHVGFSVGWSMYPHLTYFDMERFEALAPYSRPEGSTSARYGFSFTKVGPKADMHSLQFSFHPQTLRGEDHIDGNTVASSEIGLRYQFAWNALRIAPTKSALIVMCFGVRAADRDLTMGQLGLNPHTYREYDLSSRTVTFQIGPKLLIGARDINFSASFDLNVLGYATSDLHRFYDPGITGGEAVDEQLSRTDRLSFSDYAENGLLLDNIEIGVSLPIRWK